MDNSYIEVSNIKIIQKLLCALLDELHTICERHELFYSIYGGTLLGAVREHDIIPWDDDVDICMPRADYDELIKIIKQHYSDRFHIYYENDIDYPYPFAKFCYKSTVLYENNLRKKYAKRALFIDVFPVDGCGPYDEIEERFAKLKCWKKNRALCVEKIAKPSVWWKFPGYLIRFFSCQSKRKKGYRYYLDKEITESKRYSFEKSEIVCVVAGALFERGIIEKIAFLDRDKYRFGKYSFWGVKAYDSHLHRLYGDYMTPPPKDYQVPKHNYRLFVEQSLLERVL